MKKIIFFLIIIIGIGFTSCYDGGRRQKKLPFFDQEVDVPSPHSDVLVIDLPKGQKLVNTTFQYGNLCYMTRPMKENEVSEIYTVHHPTTHKIIQLVEYP